MRATVLLLICLFLLPVAFADIFPRIYSGEPTEYNYNPPKVTVYFQKNGSPDLRVTEATYHCEGSNSTETGAATQRLMAFSCSQGRCSNENSGWFYKYNPCYSFLPGFFSYTLDGKEMRTTSFTTTSKWNHDIVIDSESGEIRAVDNPPPPSPCALGYILPFIILAAFVARR